MIPELCGYKYCFLPFFSTSSWAYMFYRIFVI
jgi:hypothetical protein